VVIDYVGDALLRHRGRQGAGCFVGYDACEIWENIELSVSVGFRGCCEWLITKQS
jgi:hypothetical protein